METTPTTAPAFVTARITLDGPRHAVRNLPEHFTAALPRSNPRRFTRLRAACGAGVYGMCLDQTDAGETVPWGEQSLFHNCPACVRRVKALVR